MRAFIVADISIEILAVDIRRRVERAFIMANVFIGILVQHLRRYVVVTFKMEDISIEILTHFAIYLFGCWHQLYYRMHVSTP